MGPLAQLVEQLTLNQRAAGSIPARPTKESMGYRLSLLRISKKVQEKVIAYVRLKKKEYGECVERYYHTVRLWLENRISAEQMCQVKRRDDREW